MAQGVGKQRRGADLGKRLNTEKMSGGHLYGWDSSSSTWVKVQCDPNGQLSVDASALFEDSPSDGETSKGPTSNWAYDHENNAAAHHAKYTDAEARAAINDILDASGVVTGVLDMDTNDLKDVGVLTIRRSPNQQHSLNFTLGGSAPNMYLRGQTTGVGYVDTAWYLWDGSAYKKMVREDEFQSYFDDYLENIPSDGVYNKAPTSNWAYDHENDVDAHHAKYTDAEAQAACNKAGTLYMTLPGNAFLTENPDTDQVQRASNGVLTMEADNIDLFLGLNLPDGVTITDIVVEGNAGAASQMYVLYRVDLSDQTTSAIASAYVGTNDNSISYPVVDNSSYAYVVAVIGVDTNDEIYHCRVAYTM